jgi:hypothetical protein
MMVARSIGWPGASDLIGRLRHCLAGELENLMMRAGALRARCGEHQKAREL